MRDRSVLEEARRRLRELASFVGENNAHQASALVSLADDLARSAPDSANEQVALVLLGMDPYADPRPEFVALPHGPMSCSESEKLGNKLADVAGRVVDVHRALIAGGALVDALMKQSVNEMRHALAEWRGSWPPYLAEPVCHACGMGDSCPDHDPEVEKESRVIRVAEGPKPVWPEDPPADLRVLLSDSSGDLWDARGGTLRFSREEWAVVVEGLSALRRAIEDREDPVTGSLDPSEEVTRDMAHLLLKRISGGAGRSIS